MTDSDLFEIGPHEVVGYIADDARTVGDLLRLRARATPDRPAIFQKHDGRWQRKTWADFYERSLRVAQALADLGLEGGETVSIVGPTLEDWAFEDFGGLLAGLVTMGIFPKQSAEQIRYLLEHSGSRAVFVAEPDEMETVLQAVDGNEKVLAIIPWTQEIADQFAGRDERIRSPEILLGEPMDEEEVERRQEAIKVDDTAILVYTSGTTGPPKGAMISHGNVISLLREQDQFMRFYQDDLLISFLPMAHVSERILAFFARINTGVPAAYASSIGSVLAELQEVRPTVFGSVPRMFEKAYDKVRGEIDKKPGIVQSLFAWAVKVGKERLPYLIAEESVPGGIALRYKLAEALVFKKIRAAFGGRIRFCLTGAAPTAFEILEFFWAAGLPIYEAYGMTEATVLTHVTRPGGALKLGTVGKVSPPVECRIAEDGEILFRGPTVFKGYLKNEEATRETIIDGWLHSGDIGTVDEEGFLRVTDRKKHLIITAGGKNLAPANIEQAIKTQSPLISQVHAHGDRRQYVSALIVPSPLETLQWGAEQGLLSQEELKERTAELMANPSARSEALNAAMTKVATERSFQEVFVEPVRQGNLKLARVEKIRRFIVLERDFSQEEGELTPTMKVKRKVVETKFADRFDRVYNEAGYALEAEARG